ncbi:hypothetical protein DERF_016035 [Dermatophagoides farinae]|uniref:Uncharacterized protein n=1 Tax=Dermatophagoides farinae TaxID=6954 RepID=A0A922KS19_DERFA|nr:hypothetical protein DERF_016035 [Dermatophagoides farinae]
MISTHEVQQQSLNSLILKIKNTTTTTTTIERIFLNDICYRNLKQKQKCISFGLPSDLDPVVFVCHHHKEYPNRPSNHDDDDDDDMDYVVLSSSSSLKIITHITFVIQEFSVEIKTVTIAKFLPICRPFLYIFASISNSISCGPSNDDIMAKRTSLSFVRRISKSLTLAARTPGLGDFTDTKRNLKSTIIGDSTGTTNVKNSCPRPLLLLLPIDGCCFKRCTVTAD